MTSAVPTHDPRDIPAELAGLWHLSSSGHVVEALAKALELQDYASGHGTAGARAGCALQVAFGCLQVGRIEDGLHQAEIAAAGFRELGERGGEIRARALYAWLLAERAESETALDVTLQTLEIATHTDDLLAQSYALNVTGIVYWLIKQPDKALAYLEEAVDITRRLGDDIHQGRWLTNLAGAQSQIGIQAQESGNEEAMTAWMRLSVATAARGLALSQKAGDVWNERIILCNIAEIYCHLGDYPEAQRYLAAHDSATGTLGARAASQYRFTEGLVLAGLGRLDEAIARFQESLATEEDGDIEQAVFSCLHLARAYEAAGRFAQALAAQKKYHALYVRQAEEAVQRRARISALGQENDRLRSEADAAQHRAARLETQNLDLRRETERLSRRVLEDSLTQLANRRRLEDALFEVLVSGEPFSIAMIDVDHFKQINDGFSHVTGDAVLRVVGALIRQSCRPSDLPARYGGEEFAILMRGDGHVELPMVCERLRMAIYAHDWRSLLNIGRVTVSIGTATWEEAESPSSVLAVADRRLYLAKEKGRNRIISQSAVPLHHPLV